MWLIYLVQKYLTAYALKINTFQGNALFGFKRPSQFPHAPLLQLPVLTLYRIKTFSISYDVTGVDVIHSTKNSHIMYI